MTRAETGQSRMIERTTMLSLDELPSDHRRHIQHAAAKPIKSPKKAVALFSFAEVKIDRGAALSSTRASKFFNASGYWPPSNTRSWRGPRDGRWLEC